MQRLSGEVAFNLKNLMKSLTIVKLRVIPQVLLSLVKFINLRENPAIRSLFG